MNKITDDVVNTYAVCLLGRPKLVRKIIKIQLPARPSVGFGFCDSTKESIRTLKDLNYCRLLHQLYLCIRIQRS